MRAGELCIRSVITATEDESVVAAARRMATYHVGDLVVVTAFEELPRPLGIITDRDLVVKVLAHPERDPASTRVSEVMQRDLVTAREEDDIEHVIAAMKQHGIRRVPIVDTHGRLQGILSFDDVIGWMREQIDAATKLLEDQGEVAIPG